MRLLLSLPKGARVLEIGSGSMGIGSWYRERYVGVDIEFDREPPANMLGVIGDGTRLPFAGASADAVVCAGVLTHAIGGYEPVVHEMIRVARGHVLVVTPTGEAAHEADLRMIEFCERWRLGAPGWLIDQASRNLPSEDVIAKIFAQHGRVTTGTTLTVPWWERIFRTERWMLKLRGTMTAVQPLLRTWGERGARMFPSPGEPYERWIRLDIRSTDQQPRSGS